KTNLWSILTCELQADKLEFSLKRACDLGSARFWCQRFVRLIEVSPRSHTACGGIVPGASKGRDGANRGTHPSDKAHRDAYSRLFEATLLDHSQQRQAVFKRLGQRDGSAAETLQKYL